jgi:hypothetical protein
MSDSELVIIINPGNNSGTTNQLKFNFPSNFPAYGREICLSSMFLYFSWFNVTAAFNNLSFQYQINGTTYTITLIPGFYAVSDLNAILQNDMNTRGLYTLSASGQPYYYLSFVANPVYYAVTLTSLPVLLPPGGSNPNTLPLSGYCPQLIFNATNFNLLLGFSASTSYPPSATLTTEYQINSTQCPEISPVSSCQVTCNMANTTVYNTVGNVIYQFSPNGQTFGSQVQIQPTVFQWYPILDATYAYLQLSLTDQNGVPLGVIDPSITATVNIRKRKNVIY